MLMKRMRGWRGGPFKIVNRVAGPAPTAPKASLSQTFVGSGVFTPPAGRAVTNVEIKITGAGSASGIFAGGAADGGGGAAFSYKSKSLTIGQTVDVTISTAANGDCFATVAGAIVCLAQNANVRFGGLAANGIGEIKHSGGDGGLRDATGGGGGGGAGTFTADGSSGNDALVFGGAGGVPGGGGGANPGSDGGNASHVGSGAGGRVGGGVAGTPGAPEVIISY